MLNIMVYFLFKLIWEKQYQNKFINYRTLILKKYISKQVEKLGQI